MRLERDTSRLTIQEYIKNPNHFTLKQHLTNECDKLVEIQSLDMKVEWYNLSIDNGWNPDDWLDSPHWENFSDKYSESKWMVINGDVMLDWPISRSATFLSHLIDVLELEHAAKENLFTSIWLNGQTAYLRFENFPRRIDLFPIPDIPLLETVFKTIDKKELEELQDA